MNMNPFHSQGETKARARTRLFIPLLYAALALFATPIYGASLRKVTRSGGDTGYDAAVNLNFDAINFELFNVMHKTGTETIRGAKTFTDTITFGTISATTITLNGLSYAGNPVGTVVMYISSTVTPSGWLHCDGSSKSTTTYSRLFAIIGYTYGGSGANFNLPDFRGVFPKGNGTTNRAAGKDSSGNFYAGTIGTYSTDKMQGHYHNLVHYGTEQAFIPTTNVGVSGNSNVMHGSGATDSQNIEVRAPRDDGTNGTPRTGHTTEPQSVGISFIIYSGV